MNGKPDDREAISSKDRNQMLMCSDKLPPSFNKLPTSPMGKVAMRTLATMKVMAMPIPITTTTTMGIKTQLPSLETTEPTLMPAATAGHEGPHLMTCGVDGVFMRYKSCGVNGWLGLMWWSRVK